MYYYNYLLLFNCFLPTVEDGSKSSAYRRWHLHLWTNNNSNSTTCYRLYIPEMDRRWKSGFNQRFLSVYYHSEAKLGGRIYFVRANLSNSRIRIKGGTSTFSESRKRGQGVGSCNNTFDRNSFQKLVHPLPEFPLISSLEEGAGSAMTLLNLFINQRIVFWSFQCCYLYVTINRFPPQLSWCYYLH